jgi:hypothetical protein
MVQSYGEVFMLQNYVLKHTKRLKNNRLEVWISHLFVLSLQGDEN